MVELLPGQRLKEVLHEPVDDAYARVIRYYDVIDVEKPTTIHRLRIAFKKFRYMIEIIQPLLENFPTENFQKMHDYQGMMGDIQDMEVALQYLDDFVDSESPISAHSMLTIPHGFSNLYSTTLKIKVSC